MRVIAGRLRGSPLLAPEGETTRPITDRVKETLFNILGHRFGMPGVVPEIEALDLFAGAGSFGIECLSRGAARCVFVERDRKALTALRANLKKLRIENETQVIAENAWTMRLPVAQAAAGFGLVFVDPPYRDVAATLRVVDLLDRIAPRLAPDGFVVFRHGAATAFDASGLRLLRVVDEREFGGMRVLLLAHRETSSSEAPSEPSINEKLSHSDGGPVPQP